MSCTFNCTAIDELNGTISLAQCQSTDIRRRGLDENPSPAPRRCKDAEMVRWRRASPLQHRPSPVPVSSIQHGNGNPTASQQTVDKQESKSKIQNPSKKSSRCVCAEAAIGEPVAIWRVSRNHNSP